MNLILCCSCFNQEKKAKEAFSLLFSGEPIPDIIKGRDRIYKFAIKIGNEHIKAISKLTGKYAYYLEMDGNDIIKEYDLTTMRRIA